MSVIKRQTILGTIYSYMGVGVGIFTQALIIPNFFTTQQNGLLQVLFAYALIVAQFASLGYNQAGTRFFSYFRDAENKHRGYLFTGLLFSAVGYAVGCLALYFFKEEIIGTAEADRLLFSRYFGLMVPLSLATMLFYLFDNYAKGLYDTVHGNFYKEFLQRFLIFLSACLVAMGLIDFHIFILLWAVGICLPTLLMIFRAYRLGNFSLAPNLFFFKSGFRRQFYSFSLFSVATGFSSIIITQLDKLMVKEYLGLSNTGIYATSILFGSVMTISYNITAKASTAIVLDAMHSQEYGKVESIYKKSGVTQLILGCLILLVTWVNVDLLFSFIKPAYAAGKWALIIIGLGKLFELANGVNTLILAYSKYYKLDSVLIALFIVVLYLLNRFFIPLYGLNGAALAAVASVTYYNVTRTFLIWKYFRIQPFSLGQLLILALGAVVLLLGFQLPALGESLFERLLTVAYRSALVGGVFVAGILWLNVSEDLNSVARSVMEFVKKRLKK
jgi:O-antigen/teichoic acid export membrane protein